MTTMSFAKDIEQALRDGLREVNYNYRVTYRDMASNSGFNENTLKSFVNNETVRLPDERETAYCLIRLSRWLLSEHGCDIIARIYLSPNTHVCKNGGTTVDGDLGNEIRGLSESNGARSIADRNNNLTELKIQAREIGKLHRAIMAEIALKEQGRS